MHCSPGDALALPRSSSLSGENAFSPSVRICSGKRVGSPAASKASVARRAASWWLPWLPGEGAGSIVKRISGVVSRMIRTTLPRTWSWSHTCWVRGALTV